MANLLKTLLLLATLALAFIRVGGKAVAAEPVDIKVYATVRRSIEGISDLDRDVYFSMSDAGRGFDKRVRSEERMDYLLGELGIRFGRSLGPVKGAKNYSGAVREDKDRPGFADLDFLRETFAASPVKPSRDFKRLADGRLDVAAHEGKSAFPEFIGELHNERSEKDSQHGPHNHALPGNFEAAAELTAAVLEHGYNDFDRPVYYEPMNEPHWSFIGSDELAEWHLKTHRAVQDRKLDVLVGGPCNSVCYFYRVNYRSFNGLRDFIKKTNCELDFYSFHAYDYFDWHDETLKGRVSSGLPLEGMIDLVESYAVNEFGKPIDLVVSEHGGYVSGSQGRPSADEIGDLLAAKHFPGGEGFEHELRKRSIQSHVLVSSVIANTLTFMEHPHAVKKAVPFILLESMGWDPKYYSTLYVPYDFEDRSRWAETRNIDYYKFFRGVAGRRVYVDGTDPDLQVRAFVDGKKLHVLVNNLSDVPHATNIRVPSSDDLSIRRYGRNADYTPSLTEESLSTLDGLMVAGREAVLVTAEYDREIPERAVVEESAFYGDKTVMQPKDGKPMRVTIRTSELDGPKYATLRIAVTRPADAEPTIRVKFNGKRLEVPLEDSAVRLMGVGKSDDEYASTKLIPIDPKLVRERNRVEITFPDDERGRIGSVVLRVGQKGQSSVQAVGSKTRSEEPSIPRVSAG